MMASNNKISTRFLILSDTHNFTFTKCKRPIQHPMPKTDVILHCGDITEVGGAHYFKDFIQMLGSIEAELKLVIAGNHDLDLDADFCEKQFDVEEDGDVHGKAVEIMKGSLAKEAGVTYLEEGIHEFKLRNGAGFKIYVSPFQPVFGNWAFPYDRTEDRWNLPHQAGRGAKSIAVNPIPDFGKDGVDIVMTHGPPQDVLDECPGGNVGCENLLRAVSRARPLLHCFGHIHESYGAKVVTWEEDKGVFGWEALKSQGENQVNAYPDSNKWPIEAGRETLMINASMMNRSYVRWNVPWVIDLDLSRAS